MKKFRINRVGRINALSLLAVSILFISHVKAQNCTVNAGVPRSFCDTETVLLRGTAAGLIKEGTTIHWEQVDGPAAIISLPYALESEVLGTLPNTSMTFRLSATCADGSFVYQDVTHTVLPITKADAGPDQQVCPGIHNLAANPLGANETGMWSIKGNNNSISIDDPTDPNSSFTATEGMSGSNTLVWTIVGANKCISTDEVVITNMGGSSPVNAGPDQILSNCYSTTQRTNLAASNGGNGVSGQIGTWTIVSGPNVPTIANVNNNNSSISNLIEGTYVLQWDVAGPCASGNDRMIITVPPPTVDVTGAGDNQSLTFCDGRTEVVLRAPAPQYINETVQWVQTGGPTAIISNSGNHIANASGLDGLSNYTFTYTIRNNETACESSANVNINFAQQPTLDVPEKIIRLSCGQTSADVNFNHTGDGAVSWRIASGPETSIHTSIPTDFVRSNGNPQRIVGLTESGTYIVHFRKLAATGSQCETVFAEVKIIVSEEPDGVSIGTDQLLGCNITSTELTGNIPDQGYGTWSQVSGPNAANIVDKNSNNTTINGLINGIYVFRWIISGGSACDANQVDTRVIVADTEPTQANAGPDQNDVCIQTPIYLDANQPILNETGVWSITPQNSGEAFVDPTNPKTIINGLVANETYILTWTISNACGSIADVMTITTSDIIGPIASSAGDDICLDTGTTSFELNGTLETPGDRTWSMVSGPNSPTIVNPNQSITAVTGAIDGTYLFELRIDNNSCTSTVDTVQVTISPETSDAVAGANQFICGDNVQLGATLPEIGTGKWVQIAGAGGLNIEDLNDPNTEVTGLVSGVYKFVWEVSNNACETKRDTVVIDVSEPGLAAVAGTDQDLCGVTYTALEGNAVKNGLWSLVSGPNTPSFGDIASPSTTVSGLIMGEYTLRWSSYGGPNCEASVDDMKITVVPAADAGSDQEYCDETTSVDLVGNENSTGTWTQVTDFPMTLTTTSTNSATASGLAAGNTYIFEYTIAIEGCTSSDQVSVNLVTPPPAANAGGDQIWCDASSFSLTGNDPTDDYAGEWIVLSSPGGGTFDNKNSPNAVFTPNSGSEYGIFLFSWKISNGECGNEDQVRVSNYQPPSIAEAGDAQDVVCDSQVSMLAGNPTVGVGEWTLTSKTGDAPDPTIVSPILYNSLITNLGPQSNGDPADYVFTWTVTNGPVCDPTVDNVTITVYEIPTEADAGADDELCNVTEYTLSANAPATGTGEWTNIPSGVTFSDVNSNMATVSGLTPGETYTFTWETSTQFCTSTDEVVLTNHAEPSVPEAMAEIDICQYGDLTLTNIVPTVGTGLWTQVSGLPTILLNPNQPSTKVAGIIDGETYVFRYTISNGTCTPNSEDVTVEIYQQPTPSVAGPNQQFCNENSTTLAGNIPDIGTGSWSVVSQPATATVAFADETEANTEVSGITEPGTYVLRWTTINGTCTSYSDMRITRYEDLEITDPVGGETCENETYSMSVNASGGTGTYTYQWQYSADNSNWSNVTGGAGSNARTYSTANDLSVGSHYFRALVSDCNTLTTQEATVIINEIPVVSATNTAQEFCDGETSAVMELSSNLPFSTYSWTRNSPAGITTTQPTSGTGDIPSAIIENSSTAPQTISYTIYANGPEPSECQSAPITATIIVNPTPMVNSASALTICNESSVDYTITSATIGTTYTWSRDAVAGISNAAVTGQTGNSITEELTNETTAPIVVAYVISPTGPTACAGEDFDLVVTVNPTPNVSAEDETICSSNSTDITLSSTVSGTTFYYAAPTISGGAGNIIGGTARTSPGSAANITDNLVNTTAVDQTATYTVYPIFEGCVGTSIDVVVTVEPEPRVADQTLTVCSNKVLAFTLPAGTGVAATSFNITAINQNGLTAFAGNPATGNGLSANEIEDDAYTNATTAPVNVIYTVVPVADNGCVGAEFTVTATINPEPQVSDVGDALFCNSDQVTIDFGTQNSGGTTTYAWTNNNSDIGLAANGTGNLDFTATNPGTAAITASIEVTPTFTNNGVACTGNSKSFTITVNPSAQINAIDDQELCNNSATTLVTFETTRTDGTTTYTWTNTNPAIGLAASGSGATIPSFTATNNTHNPISGSIAVTPTYTKDDESCSGEAETFTITVNPTPIVSSVSMVTVCSASELEYIPTSFTTGTTFEWTASNTVGTVTGFTESGTGPISDVLTNAGSAEGEILYLITPTGPEPTNCVGLPFSLRVTISNCEPAIGVAKQLVNKVYNEDGTLTAKYNIRVQNYGNTQLYDVQVTEDLTDAFGAGNYEVVQLFSTSFDVNTSFNGYSNTDLLDNGGTSNILEVGASTNIELQVKILSPGSYNNSVEVNAESISGPLSDLSQNGSDPDPDGDGNPGNNDAPTPVDFGACSITASVITNTNCGNSAGSVLLSGNEAGTMSLNGTEQASPATYSNLQAGWYTATFKATATGCISKVSFEITNINSDLTGRVTLHEDVTCNGFDNGRITVTAFDGTAPYTYKVNGVEQPSNTFSDLAPGEYGCQITDANGCTYTVSFDIDEPTLLVSQIMASENESCFGAADGSATVVATGGTTPYSYIWSNGQTTATATGLAQGVYSVIVTDANGCETSASVTISGATQALAISTPALTNPVCFGSAYGSINIMVSGGTAPYSYVWSNGQASQNANGLLAGNYSVTVSDANGCSVSSETYTLTNPDEIILSVPVVTDANCDSFEDGEVQLAVASGGTAPFTFALSTGESNTSGAFDALATGGYIYTVTDANGCSASGAFEVDDPNELILTITDIVDVSCNAGSDGSFTVIATGGTEPYSYQLGNETAQPSATFNDLSAGVYLVTVRDENGCSRIQTIKITEPTELGIVLVDQVNPDCNDSGRIMLSGTGGTTPYVFTSSAGTVSGNAVSGLSAGELTITITDKNNCTETLVVTLVEEDTTAPTFTCPETQTLFADDNCQVTVPDLTALVVDAADNCSEGDLTVTQSVAAGSVISSDLTLTVTVTDEDGNASSCDVLLVVEDTTPPVAICKDITRQLDMTGTVHISPQDVDGGSSDNCGLASMELDITTFTCDDLGENTVVLTITDDAGNISTCEAIVTIGDNIAPIVDCPAPVTLTADANCEAIVPDFVSDLNVSNNCANVTATQSPEAGTTINTGVTTVTISVTDGVNTSTCTTSVTVVDQTAPTFTCPETQTIVADINCQGTLPDLTALITDANDDCTDDVIITQSIPAGTIINNDMVVTLKVTDEAGNVAECEVLVQIDYPERPTVSAGSNAEICSTTESYALSGTAVDADRVEWSTSGTGTFDDATSLEAIYTPSKADLFDGQIQLTLTAFGSGRCGIAKDNMVLTLWPQATAYAGRDANISPNSNYEIYDARASNYDSFTWTLLGDGTLQDTQTLTPVFVPNPNQTGTVSLVLSVEPYSDVCEAVTDTMTITIGEAPSINFTKRTVNTLINADGTVEVTFELSLENTGNVLLSSLSLTDNLANTFTGTCSFNVISRLSENLNLNYNYDGVNDTELLEANNTLLVGIKKSVLLTVRVQNCDPLVTTYTNEAIARATSPGGTVVNGSDTSEILLSDNPSIGLAKQLVSLVLNSDGSYSALFNFRVSNYGDVDLSNVAVYDNLDAVFGAGNFEIEEIYSENFAVNTSFAGTLNDNMLDENTKLEVGRSGAVLLKVKILTAGSYVNTATATGNNPGGDLFTDSSHNGSDAAPGGGNNPNDFSDPTEINASDCTVEVICPTTATFTFNNTPGLCGYTIPDNGLDASGSASCTAVDVSHDYGAWGNRHSLKGATFPVGTTDVTWTAKDEIGNSASCTITVTVRDREAPEFVNCPSGTTFTIGLFPGACEGGAIWSIPVARDNCSDVTVVQTRGPKQGDVLSPGTYPIEYRASDQTGNMTYCNFTIKVIDTEEPTIVCQPDLVKESDVDNCNWTSTENSLSPLLANSNCPVEVTWEVTNPDGTTASGVNDVSGYVFELGTSTVKYFISEPGSSQSSSCSFRVTVVDRHAPQIDCQDDLNIVAEAGECSATVALVPPVFTDNCSQAPASVSYYIYNPDNTVTSGTELTYEFQHGVSRIEWTTYDEAGNPGFCFQNVWVDADEESIIPDAGPDAIICESDSFRLSEATAPENVLVQWTTNGTGRFIDPTVVNAVYVPSQSDIANGFAVLTIKTSTDCASQSAHMILSIFKSPVVSAGNDAVICETDGYQLTGVSSNGTYGVEWISLGSGTFSNKNISSPVYTPGQSDIEAGEVQLVFRGIAAGSCSDALDTLTLNIDRQPLVNAGSDGWICEDETLIVSDAAAMFAGSTFWTSSGTGTFDDPSLLNAGYTPSRADIINGSVMLTISSYPTGPCSAVSDKLLLTISARPVADAGGDLATCAGESIVISNAKASNFTSIHWSSSGTGVLENAATMNPTYVPGENESGTIALQMEVIGNNACGSDTVYDAIQLRIYDQIIVDAGPDQILFFNKPAKLSVEVENGSGSYFYSWQPSGLVLDENARTTETVNLTSTTRFEVTVTDGKTGCWAVDMLTVNVEEDQDKILNIFNAFSPNGDGVNDTWIIEGIENFPDNKVKIFNRWGDQIIALDRYDNANSIWDGRNPKGNLVPDGTYFYIVEITGLKSYTGWVHIRSEQ